MPQYVVKSPDGVEYDVNAPEGATQQDAIRYVQGEVAAGRLKPKAKAAQPVQPSMGPMRQALEETGAELSEVHKLRPDPFKGAVEALSALDLPYRAAGNAVMDVTGSPALATAAYALPQFASFSLPVSIWKHVQKARALLKPVSRETFDQILARRLAEEGVPGLKKPAPVTEQDVDAIIEAIEHPPAGSGGPSKPIKTEPQKAGQAKVYVSEEDFGPGAGNLDDVLPPVREGPRLKTMPDLPEQEFPGTKLPQEVQGPMEPKPVGTKPVKPTRNGNINPALVTRLASSAAGALVGAGLDPNDPIQGAVYGAAGGFALGHIVSRRVMSGGFGSALRVATNPGAMLHNAKDAEIAAGRREASEHYEALKALNIPEDRGIAVIRAIETGDFRGLSPQENQAAQIFLREVGRLGAEAQEAGVIQRLKRNYVPLLFDWSDKKTADTLRRMGAQDPSRAEKVSGFSTFTPFQLERTIDDYATAARLGLKPKTTSLHELFGMYANSVIRATQNKRARVELQTLKDAQGRPLVTAGTPPPGWQQINKGDTRVPELEGFWVHPEVADSVRVGFASHDPDVIARAALNTSWFAKRFNVSLSSFHPMALLQAYVGAGGNPFDVAAGALARGIGKVGIKVPYESAIDKALAAYRRGGAGDAIDLGIRNGLRLEAPIEDRAGRDAFIKTMTAAERFMTDHKLTEGSLVFKGARVVDEGLQRFTWDYLYSGMKLSTFSRVFQREVERNMARADAGKEALKPLNQIAEDVASYVNSTFGGLDLRRIAETMEEGAGKKAIQTLSTPRGQAYAQMAVFAPDWKLSTLQAWTRGLGLTGDADLQRLHREYLVRSAFMSAVLMDAVNLKLSGHHVWQNDFHTKRGHEQTFAEKVNDATYVDLGDGRKMQMFKHLMEGPHAVSEPQKFALNALGYMPRVAGTIATNKQFLTPDWAPPIAESYLTPLEKAYRYGTWPLKQAAPIVGQQFDAGWGPTFGGFAGMPIYGLTDEQKVDLRVKRMEDRARAMGKR